MPFPFTFNFAVPGLSNPFSPPPLDPTWNSNPRTHNGLASISDSDDDILNITARPTSSSSSSSSHHLPRQSPGRTSKKRGWEPSYPEPSQSMATLASSSGYLDTPAKYRELAAQQGSAGSSKDEGFQYVQRDFDDHDDHPPAKRRRGLAGSIISSAVSAALIGTAVGLTVYRLFRWRDRGKEPEPQAIEAPPPYSESESNSKHSLANPNINVIPPSPRNTPRRRQAHASTTPRRRRRAPAPLVSSSSSAQQQPQQHPFVFPKSQPHFDFTVPSSSSVQQAEDSEPQDRMDWIGDKLSALIEEGKRALGREVVVMSESAEDEVDDGRGDWVEEDDEDPLEDGRSKSGSVSPRRASIRRKGSSRRLGTHHSPSASQSVPSTPGFSPSQSIPIVGAMTPQRQEFGFSGSYTPSSSVVNDRLDSPDIRESMERARRKVLEARAAKGLGLSYS